MSLSRKYFVKFKTDIGAQWELAWMVFLLIRKNQAFVFQNQLNGYYSFADEVSS